ncbi:MAG: N-acetylmuramoyl-L-alanine amidase [Roseitalea sp.]|nr:N-acetylmuramoyl-L-alanine amidase [Roseitalea sp.]MBO6950562.1 N-acetylmuramoyl-L-alanine amidase [Rhizobiaceae bacterium]MBO6591451.1 N-acetylmuramoyl-L-alanine amidase [Roseitalea sp.]MBO6599306.1 N-acetylmuramoyl-L-alanine amidase [Roseitalea sp.]MBO6612205.1 N-acetylmuramoyl-L-alanine amidase [Roseitalea sp.]
MRPAETGTAQGPGSFAARLFAWLVLALAVSLGFAHAAQAAFDAPVAVDVRAAGDADATRIIISFDRPVSADHKLLDHPYRLVLDFERIGYGFEAGDDTLKGMVGAMRYGDMSETGSRIIFEIGAPFEVVELSSGAAENFYRLIIDLRRTDEAAFQQALLDTMATSSIIARGSKTDRLGSAPLAPAPRSGAFTVVLDPGHGGIDSGAVGVGGTREKDVVLAFARTMRDELQAIGGVEVVMTREDDVFISLDERVRFARQHGAALFVSLHADSVRQSYVRGATVYTISDKASDSVAAEIARSENLSDSIAGIVYEQESGPVADILVDLARQETLGFSVQFARLAISHISRASRIINNPHRYAGFRVLKAPDVPSVLVELGYLSNREDEKLLNKPEWRAELAAELAAAVAEFGALSGRQLAGEARAAAGN